MTKRRTYLDTPKPIGKVGLNLSTPTLRLQWLIATKALLDVLESNKGELLNVNNSDSGSENREGLSDSIIRDDV